MNIKNWSVLNKLDRDFMKNVKQIEVFGINGDQVIVITNEDNVYAFGSNSDGCLGLGHTKAAQQPTLIPQLCQKQVTKLEFGGKNFVLALTKSGAVYSWGDNTYGQLGNGNTTSHYTPVIITALNDNHVIDIKCGKIHWLAMTSTGDVYLNGYSLTTRIENPYSFSRYIFNGHNPTKMSIPTTTRSKKILSIDSGLYHALALTDNGDVYCWGDYANGKQMDNNINRGISMHIQNIDLTCFQSINWSHMLNVIDIPITEIACGPYHGLMLSSKSKVFCFGDNNFGQCGDATIESKINPTKFTKDINFKAIGATNNYDISTALSENGFCYVWGKCGETTMYDPIKTI